MEGLTIKTVYFNQDYSIVERNKDFYIYFEKVNSMLDSINDLEFGSSEEKEEFIKFIKTCNDPKEFKIFSIKNISGEFRTNLAFVRNSIFMEKEVRELRLIDLQHSILFFYKSTLEEKLLRTNLSITNDYMFVYHQKSNNFKMVQFFQNRKIVLYDQDLDSWNRHVVTGGLIPSDQNKNFEKMLKIIKTCPETFNFELRCGLRGDIEAIEDLSFIGVRLEEEGEIYLTGRIINGTKFQESQKSTKIIEELQIDSLTKVYNKKTITAYGERRIKLGQKENCALIILDLDHFKPVNDAYGHLAGDNVLEKTGKLLLDIVGENGLVGRYGGDEFLLIVENIDNEQVQRGLLRTLMVSIRNAFQGAFEDINITASLGCARFPLNGNEFTELFKKADFCLYRAKDKGRDRYVFYRDDLHGELYKKAIEAKSGVKYDEREILELKYMSEFMQQLNKAPFQAIKTVLQHMQETYNLDSINIYYGEDMKRIYNVGKKDVKLAIADYVYSEAFKTALSGKSYVRIDFPREVSAEIQKFRDLIVQRGVQSTIQCVLGSPDNIRGIVTFDRLKEPSLWAEYEFNCCVMFAAALTLLPESVKVDFALYSKLKD